MQNPQETVDTDDRWVVIATQHQLFQNDDMTSGVPCVLGRSGVIDPSLRREGDGTTPLGLYSLREILYRPDRLALYGLKAPTSPSSTRLPWRALTPADGWCDDPHSPDYNQRILIPGFSGRHEVLWRDDHVYDLMVVIGFNDAPVVPGRGSALFVHLARPDGSPTEGCVAVSALAMVQLITTLRQPTMIDIRR